MTNLSDIINALPRMKSGNELITALKILPEYTPEICAADTPLRLMALSDLYRVYIPSQMSLEIYSKLYLALLRSMQKKGTKLAVQQQNQNYRAIMQQEYNGIMGGSDSFTIIGTSGIGKSSAISRAITLITENRVIEAENPYIKGEGLGICNSKEPKYVKNSGFSVMNTVLKMAKKRALVDAVLNVACLSARFTQDVEDMNMEPEQPSGKGPASQPQPTQQPRTDRAASQKQIAYLEKLMQDCGTSAASLNRYVQKNYGVDDYHKITSLMASELIQKFQGAMTR